MVDIRAVVHALRTCSDQTVGVTVASLSRCGDLSSEQLGQIVRAAINGGTDPGPSEAEPEATVATVAPGGADLPETPAAQILLRNSVFEAFNGEFRRRSVASLARRTGLNENAVLELIAGSNDFELVVGNTGTQFVKVRDL